MKIGTKVKFNVIDNTIPCFYSSNEEGFQYPWVKHGSIVFKKNDGKIVAIEQYENDDVYAVEYTDIAGEKVVLGFRGEDLIEIYEKSYL